MTAFPPGEAFAAEAVAKSKLTGLLEAELAQFPAKSGFYVKNLTTGEEASVHGNDHFESASTIKLAALVLAFRMADAHQLDLNERVVLKADDLRGGSGVFRYKGPGLNPSVRDLLTEMVITGDTTGVTNDVGIVYAKSGPIVMTAYNMAIKGSTEQVSERIGRVARLAYEYFEGDK